MCPRAWRVSRATACVRNVTKSLWARQRSVSKFSLFLPEFPSPCGFGNFLLENDKI